MFLPTSILQLQHYTFVVTTIIYQVLGFFFYIVCILLFYMMYYNYMLYFFIQIHKFQSDSHILACAPSNSAADLLAERILNSKIVAKKQLLRLNAASRPWKSVSEKIQDCCNYSKMSGQYYFPKVDQLKTYRVIITTLTTAGRQVGLGKPQTKWDRSSLKQCQTPQYTCHRSAISHENYLYSQLTRNIAYTVENNHQSINQLTVFKHLFNRFAKFLKCFNKI